MRHKSKRRLEGRWMKVIVCGGRQFTDKEVVFDTLDLLHKDLGFTALVHGAAKGADSLAGAWATKRGIQALSFPADWENEGNQAGLKRNRRMLEDATPDLVVAFPGGRGTTHMVRLAWSEGVKILRISREGSIAEETGDRWV
jgi:hypothetical protein